MALGENSENSEHSDAATPNSLTPNLQFLWIIKDFLGKLGESF